MFLVELVLIGVSLSMDAFSLAISLSKKIRKTNKYAAIVGLFHFIMPILGFITYSVIKHVIYIPSKQIFVIVILFIIFGILIDKKENIDKFINPILFAFTVSIDSFSVGLSLNNSLVIASLIFPICSSFFTKLGFYIGFKIKSHKKIPDKFISVFILLALLIYNILT